MISKSLFTLNRLGLSLGLFLLGSLVAIPGHAAVASSADLVLLEKGKSATSLQLFIGDSKNWALPVVDGEAAVSARKRVSVAGEADIQRVSWRGRGEGQFYLTSAEALDVTPWVMGKGALVMRLRIDQAPRKQVALRLGCGYPCAGTADVTRLFQALPAEQWLQVSIDLACFAGRGLDPSNVVTPLLLLTSGKFGLSLEDVRLVRRAGPAATVRC